MELLLALVKIIIIVIFQDFFVLLFLSHLCLGILDSAAKVSESLAHHHFLGEGSSLQELLQVLLLSFKSNALVLLDV